jgi:hypothetical protein
MKLLYVLTAVIVVSSLHQAARPLLQADYGCTAGSTEQSNSELICDEEGRQLDPEKQSAIGEDAMHSCCAKISLL